MKNNIIIAGVPRAGKSTLSHQMAKRFGYQHISMDSIIAGFERCFPETGVNTYAGLSSMDTLRLISGKMAPFIRAMLDSGKYDELIQKKYDTEKDYTFYKSDEELREGAAYIVEQSLCMKKQCQEYGLPYFETTRNREQVFCRFLQDFNF